LWKLKNAQNVAQKLNGLANNAVIRSPFGSARLNTEAESFAALNAPTLQKLPALI